MGAQRQEGESKSVRSSKHAGEDGLPINSARALSFTAQVMWSRGAAWKSIRRCRMNLDCCYDFIKLVQDFGGVGGLLRKTSIRGWLGRNLQLEFVACLMDEGVVNAPGRASVLGEFARLQPIKGEAADHDRANGILWVEAIGNYGGHAGFGRECRVDNELESAVVERGVGIGVRRNGNKRDEVGTRLIGSELLLSFANFRVFRIGRFVQEVVSRIPEGDSVRGVLVDSERGIARRMFRCRRRVSFRSSKRL